ncbi:MAG: helix-turn-helix domain-containing protein [Bryobacterales bacterium]|nr:helix-turn-helix domain-containing protein [Bryobacterales bacterium]
MNDFSSGEWSMAELCRFYGITRATGYKWIEGDESGGVEALRDQSRAPRHHPNAIPVATEKLVLALRRQHPTCGAPKIRARLGIDHPAIGRAGGEHHWRDPPASRINDPA